MGRGKVSLGAEDTDDGVARGWTMEAALRAVRLEKPKKLIAAIPVGPEEVVKRLARLADETICLCAPKTFESVSQFYDSFLQVDDVDIVSIVLEEIRKASHAH